MPPNWPIISFLFSKKSKERQFTFQVKESTIVGVPEPLQKPNRIKPRKITAFGLPTPLDNIQTIGFITGNAIPSLENLLMIIRRRSHTGIIDPHPIWIIARWTKIGVPEESLRLNGRFWWFWGETEDLKREARQRREMKSREVEQRRSEKRSSSHV